MSTIENTWPADACDGISIWAPAGDIAIVAADDNQIKLESDVEQQFPGPAGMQIAGRWLMLRMFGRHADAGNYTLHLPASKSWALQLWAGQGDVSMHDIQGRLRVDLPRGDIQIEDCRGVFTISTGTGDVRLERCHEAEMPDMPPQPEGAQDFRMPPFPEGPMNAGPRRNWQWDNAGDSTSWGNEWATWGMEVANQARNWSQQFRQIFGPMGWTETKDGVGVHVGHGDTRLEDVEARTCAIRIGSGDTTIDGGWFTNLRVKAGRGDIQCTSAMPGREWAIETAHGDINLDLPANAQARLDVATRHGDINSQVPLVRVGRPGPEARYGGRMVGTLGKSDAQTAEISLVSMHGDIEIDVESTASPHTGQQQESATPAKAAAAPDVEVTATPVASGVKEAPADGAPDQPGYSTEMAILQALSEGKITAAEAEQLLRNLGV